MEKVLKIFALAAFVIFVAASTAIDGTVKIGYLNSAAILAELPEVKSANADLEVFQTQLQKKAEKMMQDFEASYKAAAQKQQAGLMSPSQAAEEEAKLKQQQETIGKNDQEMRQKLAEKQQALIGPIMEKVNSAIESVGKEGGYKMIFDVSVPGVVVYADESEDISAAVKAKL